MHLLCPQVKAGHVQATPLAASGGASGVGASIAKYVESCDADMVVLGSRGLHGWHRWVSSTADGQLSGVRWLCVQLTACIRQPTSQHAHAGMLALPQRGQDSYWRYGVCICSLCFGP
jgi:hypothetical protein